jgi:predicted cupin superfamily sugar epimerase
MGSNSRADWLINLLGLQPHPEGGHYGEVHRSSMLVEPLDGRGPRPAITTIYFLLDAGDVSRWHRVQSDEVWHIYEGAPLELWIADPSAVSVSRHELGPVSDTRGPVLTVPAGCWQAARSSGEYTLAGCSVGPGFDFADFTLARESPPTAELLRGHSGAIAGLL